MDKRALKKLSRLLNDFPKTVQDIAEKNDFKYQKKARKEMTQIARMAIDDFYDSYDPHVYDRWGDLHNAYKVIVNDKVWKIDYNSKYMKHTHRASNEYIFLLSFMSGYHGGAINGPDHPAPGTLYGPNLLNQGIPYYRNYPYYDGWLRPAVKSESPFQKIEEGIGEYFNTVNDNMNNDFRQQVYPYMEEIRNQIKKTFSK